MNNAEKIIKLKKIAEEEGLLFDRYNNIKYCTVAGEYRFKIKKNVVWHETKTSMGIWRRVRSYKISKINFDEWRNGMKRVGNYGE